MPCILKDDIKKLRNAISDKGGMSALRGMTAEQRIGFFADYVDMKGHREVAEWLNREMEKRLFIPAQTQATKDWLKRLEKKGRPIKQKQPIIDRIVAKKDVMNPRESRQYMESVAKQLMGFEIDRADAKAMFDLSASINELKKKLLSIVPDYDTYTAKQLNELSGDALKARTELGVKLVEFQRKYEEVSLKAQAREYQSKGWFGKKGEQVLKVAGNIKSLKASVDFSFLRQLQNTAYVNWGAFKNAMKSGYKAWIESEQGVDTMLADLLTRPNALNGNYNNFGIEVGIKEEAFPESWASKGFNKIKLIGNWANVFRRSEAGFNLALQTARADLFDWMWEQTKGDRKLLEAQKVGEAINTITGRGKFPWLTSKDEKQNRIMNNLLFAPKWLASRIQTLTDIWYIRSIKEMTPQGIRARAAVGNVIMLAVITNVIKAALWALDDDDDDDERDLWEFLQSAFEPRSTDFGKIRVGNTRFDLSTGTAGLVTLFSRLFAGQTVSASGVKSDVKRWEVLGNFISGKGSPFISNSLQLLTNTDYFGDERKWDTAGEIASNVMSFLAPISISGTYETIRNAKLGKTEGVDTWAAAGGVLADIVGVSSNTWKVKDKDLGKSAKAIKMEQRIAWATNKKPITAKLNDDLVVFRGKTDEQIEQIKLDFQTMLGQAEDALINTNKFKYASMEEKDEMLREMRKQVYEQLKIKQGLAKPKKRK
jgi:hypothetical protein